MENSFTTYPGKYHQNHPYSFLLSPIRFQFDFKSCLPYIPVLVSSFFRFSLNHPLFHLPSPYPHSQHIHVFFFTISPYSYNTHFIDHSTILFLAKTIITTTVHMSTSTASASASNNLPSDSRSRPLRRLSQLRSYTQTHFPLSSTNNNNSNNNNSNGAPQRASYRNSFSSRVPWRNSSSTQPASATASGPDSAAASSCPEPERQSTLARYSSAFFSSYRGDRKSVV